MPASRTSDLPATLVDSLKTFLDDNQGEIAAGNTTVVAEMLGFTLINVLGYVPKDQPVAVVFDEHPPGASARSGTFFLEGSAFRFTCHRGATPPQSTR